MSQSLCDIEKAAELIRGGAALLIAGEERLLTQLPPGMWIGGTIPYFVGQNGGTFSRDRLFVTELPGYSSASRVARYDQISLASVYEDGPDNGFSVVIIPGMSETHLAFALNAPDYPGFATRPLVGWIAGVDLGVLGKVNPKVVDGTSGQVLDNGAVVMHVTLPKGKTADVGIINIFKPGAGDTLRFEKTGFAAKQVVVNGAKVEFADYVAERQIDTKLPLVADYAGAMINISFQAVSSDTKEVVFYAPVFEGAEYRVAAPVGDYVSEFTSCVPDELAGTVIFSCNCILNYLYSELEGKRTGQFVGPVTFGEIAYQLVNQTLVYLQVIDT